MNTLLPDFQNEDFPINISGAAKWQMTKNLEEVQWSENFLGLLGFDEQDAPFDFEYFIRNIVHPENEEQIRMGVEQLQNFEGSLSCEARLKHQYSGYLWFKVMLKTTQDLSAETVIEGCIEEIEYQKTLELQVTRLEKQLMDAGKMGDFGSWEVNVRNLKVQWSKNMYKLLRQPEDLELNIDTTASMFHPSSISEFTEAFTRAIKTAASFAMDLRMVKGDGEAFWVRCTCEPIIIGDRVAKLRGLMQDIDEMKNKELDLQKLTNRLTEKNERLLNFAHIISHNLRNHTSNLQMLMAFVEESKSDQEKLDILPTIGSVSKSLTETLGHLMEITRQTTTSQLTGEVELAALMSRIEDSLSLKIEGTGARIEYDFSELPSLDTVPAYMESIITNLVSNSIKYHHPERKPLIEVRSFYEGDKKVISVKDNGLGIDMEKYGQKLFGMYNTFHKHKDSTGIGLFITKNQVEALGGKIEVQSTPDVGTEFRVVF